MVYTNAYNSKLVITVINKNGMDMIIHDTIVRSLSHNVCNPNVNKHASIIFISAELYCCRYVSMII